ncbi:unnamed protein product [Adineta steineri]|uniref:Uncharacterized protein n=1 Tax=Adineta steineri TaxID=433720 RepID=A0A813MC64_9BILA|nr:unnamed protein product [Adineta steineri]
MTSVISAFSLFVLVLVSGCFTLPIVERSSTLSSFDNHVSTEEMFASDSTPELELRRLSEGMNRGFNMPTSTGNDLPEDFTHASYMAHEHSASEHFTFEPTTERMFVPKRDAKDSYAVDEPIPSERFNHTLTEKFDASKVGAADMYAVDESIPSERFEHHPTVEGFVAPKRAFDELFMTTVESDSESEPMKRSFDDASFGTTEQTIQNGESHYKTDVTTDFIKSKMDMESTTDFMTTFTSTIAPEFHTTKLYPSTFTSTMSTGKFTGHLDDDEEEHEKPKKTLRVSKYDTPRKTQTTTVEPEDDSHIRVAEYDQSASDKLIKMPNDLMVLDDKSDVVTIASIKLTTDMMKNEPKEKMLNQGSTLLLFLLAALLFCACLTASTLAFVSSFGNERTFE